MNVRGGLRWAGWVTSATALLVGCTITKLSDEPDGGAGGAGAAAGQSSDAGPAGQGGTAGEGPPETVVPAQSGELETASTCEELEQKLKADAIERDGERIDKEIAYVRYLYGNDGGTAGSAGAAGAGGDEQPSQAGGIDYTQTNAQAQGVDEADIVKTDGEHIYFLHGEVFTVLDAWPADQLAYSYARTIEGKPLEMFVHGGRAVVYSHVNGTSVYTAAGVQPRPRMYEGDSDTDGVPSDIPWDRLLTKATVIELQAGTATVTGELYFEGAYLSARRVDDAVRTVVQGGAHGPALETYPESYGGGSAADQIAAWEALREANKQRIEAATYGDWMPYRFVRSQGNTKLEVPTCESFFVPAAGSTSHGLVQLQTFSWTSPTQVNGISLAARARHVYATKDAIYVAATAANYAYYDEYYYNAPDEERPPAGTVVPLDHTYIHKFDVSDPTVAPVYVASGTVRGATLNQFAMDEKSGHLRVATTESQIRWEHAGDDEEAWPEEHTTNHVFVLKETSGKLTEVGRIPDFVRDEKIHSVRFMDDWGYVVTFEELDPLFVLDLSSPTAPAVVGETVITGFSEYVHPIEGGHLLTIGQETEDTGAGPMPIGVALQVFDVSAPTQPVLKHKHVFDGEEYAFSEAQNTHKAFVYNPDLKVVVFPYVAVEYGTTTEIHSALEVFSVDTEKGFTKLGAPTHDEFFTGTWQWCFDDETYGAAMRRGLFIQDFLYSVSYGGVKVHAMSNLTTPVASVNLAMPSALGYECAPPW